MEEVIGDIFEMKDVFLCHQCNCSSRGSVAGLARKVFERWPEANTYKTNTKRIPGTVDVFQFNKGEGVVNLYAQKGYGQLANSVEQSQRLEWFKSCLEQLSFLGDSTVLAFPYKIGCGLAGGDWVKYKGMIEDFAARNKHLKVIIVKNK